MAPIIKKNSWYFFYLKHLTIQITIVAFYNYAGSSEWAIDSAIKHPVSIWAWPAPGTVAGGGFGAVHLSDRNADVLRQVQGWQNPPVEHEGQSLLDLDCSLGTQSVVFGRTDKYSCERKAGSESKLCLVTYQVDNNLTVITRGSDERQRENIFYISGSQAFSVRPRFKRKKCPNPSRPLKKY